MTFNIGDSRIYLVDREKAVAVTRDQSLLQDKLDKGIITGDQAGSDPERNVLLQCLGTSVEVEPEVRRGELKGNATVLACSDGFWRKLEPGEIHSKLCPQMCVTPDDMLEECRKLADLAVGRREQDNISVAALCLEY